MICNVHLVYQDLFSSYFHTLVISMQGVDPSAEVKQYDFPDSFKGNWNRTTK